MTKKELIKKYAESTGTTKLNSKATVETVISLIADGLQTDGAVDIYGFGSFYVETIPERVRKYTFGDNKGEEYVCAEHKKIKFRPSASVVESVQ